MLYDKRWDKQVKFDSLTLPPLVAWLETQPADKAYCFDDIGGCLLFHYLTGRGHRNVIVGGTNVDFDDLREVRLPRSFRDVAHDYPRTYGAALSRARKALQG